MLDGVSAVAFTEACISESAALAASYPAAAGTRVWQRQQTLDRANHFGQPLTSVDAESPRGALAAAIGMAMSGQRATVFFSGPDFAGVQDLLMQASGQHLPLVIHLACRAPAGHAQALGSGHEAYAAACDAGFLQLFATNVQEAVDLTLIARRVTERALVPAVVAMDGEQTAMAAQDVRLPGEDLVRAYIGEPSQRIEAPTDAQRLIFGATRRLVPRMYDLERPLLLSPLQGPESWDHGAAGRRPYFCDHLGPLLSEAFEKLAQQTGRPYGALFEHQVDDAKILLVAQGSAVETAVAVADWAHARENLKIGVLGIRCLRPLPVDQIAGRIRGAQVVAVLERLDTPLAGDGPLLRELRTAVGRAREYPGFGEDTHRSSRKAKGDDQPRFVSVPCGLGGAPLRSADLLALVRELSKPHRSLVYLGLDFTRPSSAYPKRQALSDTLHRSYGGALDALGLRSAEKPPDVRPKGATTIAIHRLAGREFESLAGNAAALIHAVVGGQLRSRPALTWQRFDQPCVEYLIHGPAPLSDPGDDGPVEIAMLASPRVHQLMDLTTRLTRGGALLLASERSAEELWSSLPERVCRDLQVGDIGLYAVGLPDGDRAARDEPWLPTESLLGGLLALFLKRAGGSTPTSAKIRSAREAALDDVSEEDRTRRLDVFVAAFESLQRVEPPAAGPGATQDQPPESSTPLALRRLSRADRTLDCLPRFWDQVGVLYSSGETDEMSPDPYLAAGAIPLLSSTFRDVSGAREILPVFDPDTCDGNGRSWTSCPDGSVAPLVISAKALIEAGINLASSKGKPADTLRGVAGRLASRVNKIVKEDDAPTTAAALLSEAFSWLMERTEDSDRKASLEEAFKAIVEEVGELPLVHTKVFFDDAERESSGAGELFALVVNPDACKSAEVILAGCQGRGLRAVEQTPERVEAARRLWNLWQQLPDTSGQTIERASRHPDVGPLAAMMLSRHCLLAMAGGDGAEAGSGAKLALRQVLATAEYHLQPRLQQHLQQIESLRQQLAERIRKLLSDALPTSDLDALAEGLELLGRRDVDLATLSGKVDAAVTSGRVDGARLGRLVDAARGLADLHWRLSRGPDGLGRARAGVAIAPGSVASWSAVFPYNPFQSPVAIDASGETGQFARGLIEGQLSQTIAGLRLMRWARLELERPNEAPRAAEDLARLRFSDLTKDERSLCPPVLVVGDGQSLGGRGLSQLVSLLDSELPVKVVVLSDMGSELDCGLRVDSLGGYPAGERFDLALLALLARKAFVAQTSIAHGDHFVKGVLGALAFDGPALLHIHAPSPQRHGFAAERLNLQAKLAVESRAFPLLIFDPSAGGVFGSCLDLSGNPDATAVWHTDNDRRLTPVDWAASEDRFAQHFAPLPSGDPAPTAIADYLALAPGERDGKTPYVTIQRGAEEERLRVGGKLIADAEQRLRLWQTLQELAGVITPFTKRVREQAESDLAEDHAAEITRLKQEYEAKIARLKAEFDAEATRRVTEGLMALAGYGPANGGGKADV